MVKNTMRFTRLCIFFCLAVGLATGCDVGGEQPPLISPEELLAITQSQNADSLVHAYERAEMLEYARLLLLSLKAYELKPDSVTSYLLSRSIPDSESKVAVYLSLIRLMFAEGPQDTTSRLFASSPEHTGYISEDAFSMVATTGLEAMRRFVLFAVHSGGHTSVSNVPDLLIDLLTEQPELFLAALAQIDDHLAREVVGQMEGLGDWSVLREAILALHEDQRHQYKRYSSSVLLD